MNELSTSAASEDSMQEQRQRALKQRRRRRRAAAGRSGGTFELLRHGNQLTYQYVSPDHRRHQPRGQFTWEHTSSTGGFNDFNARSIHSQSDHDSTPKTSPLAATCESRCESQPHNFGAALPHSIANFQDPGRRRYQAYVESVYSGISAQEATFGGVSFPTVIPDTPRRLSDEGAASQHLDLETGQAINVQNTRMAVTEGQNESFLGVTKLKYLTKEKTFGRMKDIGRMVKKIVDKRTGTSAPGKMGRLFSKAFPGKRSTVEKEKSERVCDSQNVGNGNGFEVHLHNPNTPQGRTIERSSGTESESPVKEQIMREQENHQSQECLNKTFFTLPAGQKKLGKRPAAPLD